MTTRRADIVLPAGLTPRLLSREQAAAYVGLSANAFDGEVAAGTFPKPFPLRDTKRLLWDREELDRTLDARLTCQVEIESWVDREKRWQQNRPKAAR